MDDKKRKLHTMIILAAYGISGTAALIYEITWTRALSLVLGNTVYALSTMLGTFMAGLAIGAYLGGKLSQRTGNILVAFALCELGIAVTGILSIPIIYRLPSLYLYIYKHFHPFPAFFFMFQVFMCFNVMILPTILMGASFPIVCRSITTSLDDVGKETGRVYSFNTIGAVVGSFAAGFFLIPTIGVKASTFTAASANTAIALAMFVLAGKKKAILSLAAFPMVIIAGGWKDADTVPDLLNFYTVKYVPSEVSHRMVAETERRNFKEVFSEEHPQGLVRAFTSQSGAGLVLQVDGKVEGTGAGDMPNTLLLAYLPIAYHGSPESFLNIGLGAGVTLAAAKQNVKKTEVIEINPGVVRAVRLFGKSGLLDGVEIHVNDARNYLFRNPNTYDIISSEPSIPTSAPSASLFTKEFFELVSSRLNPGGVFCQWLPSYLLKENDLNMMIKTFGGVFPHMYLWRVHASNDVIMVGLKMPSPQGIDEIRRRVNRLNDTSFKLDYSLILGPDDISRIIASADIDVNTDDRPRLEFRVVRNLLQPASK